MTFTGSHRLLPEHIAELKCFYLLKVFREAAAGSGGEPIHLEKAEKKWCGAGGVGSFHLLHVGVQFVDLWLEESFEFGPLGLQGRSQQAVLDGELLWVEVNVFHLHQEGRGKSTDG